MKAHENNISQKHSQATVTHISVGAAMAVCWIISITLSQMLLNNCVKFEVFIVVVFCVVLHCSSLAKDQLPPSALATQAYSDSLCR